MRVRPKAIPSLYPPGRLLRRIGIAALATAAGLAFGCHAELGSADGGGGSPATTGPGAGSGKGNATTGSSTASSNGTSGGPGANGTSTGAGTGIPAGGDYPMPPGVGTAQTVYVDDDGDDANDGLSLASPVATLGHALDVADPGSIIEVRAGSYDGVMISDGSFGTEAQWILLRAYQGEEVVVRGSGAGPTIYFYADSCDEANGLVSGDCAHAYFRIEGISVQGSPDGGGDGNAIKIDTPAVQLVKNRLCCAVADVIKNVRTADDTKIVGNEIFQNPALVQPSDNAQGVDITGADRLLVAANHFHDLTDIAMYAKGNARETVFESNLVEDTGLSGDGNAIMCGQSTDAERLVDGSYESYDCLVRNNVVTRVAGACVAIGSSQNARVYHNTCIDTARSIHAPLFLTNESEVLQPSTGVDFRGNLVVQPSSRRMFGDTGEVGMTDWSTLTVSDNLYFAAAGEPVFTLENGGVYEVSFDEWNAAYGTLTGHTDASLRGDPAFEDAGTLELGAGSPAVDAIECFAASDYDGTPRPQGARCDVGAKERIQ